MRPYERHRRARRSAVEKILSRQIDAIPDLLWNQPARARLRGYRLSESRGDIAPAGGGRDSHIVSRDIAIRGEVRIADKGPALDIGVPRVGGLAQICGERNFVSRGRKIRGGEQGGDLDRQREG